MTIVNIIGGLGNQMFQYAFGMALAKKGNTIFKIDIDSFNNYELRDYELNVFTLKVDIASQKEIKRLKYTREKIFQKIIRKIKKGTLSFSKNYYKEQQFNYNENIYYQGSHVYFDGYWQSEKYFLEYRDILLNDFTLKNDLTSKSKKYKKNIIDTNSVSLHIRRGDYISNEQTNNTHGTCDLKYYQEAVKLIKLKIKNPTIFIFSDDLQWARKNLNFIDNLIFVELSQEVHDSEEMYLMSQCQHNIIANSSFSWWGAWLNQYNNKIVIAPKKWFNDRKMNNQTTDLIPENWIKL